MTPHAQRDSTPAQLRQDIDEGRTGDKVAAPDPAAAPLGTDEEAAGTPLSADDIAEARAHEARSAARHPTMAAIDTKPSEKGGKYLVLTTIGLVVVCMLAILGYLLMRGPA